MEWADINMKFKSGINHKPLIVTLRVKLKLNLMKKSNQCNKHTDLLFLPVPLKVEVVTTKRVVRSGEEVSLNCSMTTAPKSVVWVKDQRRIVPDHRIRRISATHLKILVFQREDSGIYQCYVYNDWESAQAHVQLDLKGIFK